MSAGSRRKSRPAPEIPEPRSGQQGHRQGTHRVHRERGKGALHAQLLHPHDAHPLAHLREPRQAGLCQFLPRPHL